MVQGVTELFPISSLGHGVLLPAILNWPINESNNFFLIFLVATHLATALVLLVFFYKDWLLIIRGFFRSIGKRKITDTYEKLSWFIIVATIPAGILGLLFEKQFRSLFASSFIIAIFLILNGLMLFLMEKIRHRKIEGSRPDEEIAKLSWKNTLGIGLSEAIALLPGFSRTGASLGGGLLSGLDHEAAARFSFLLATPIILAAAVLKLPQLIQADQTVYSPILAGFISAAIAAYFSIRFLTKYFKTHTLKPFAIYCILAGLLSLIILVLK